MTFRKRVYKIFLRAGNNPLVLQKNTTEHTKPVFINLVFSVFSVITNLFHSQFLIKVFLTCVKLV